MSALWRELRDWKMHWSTMSFFQALFFGLVFTLLDTGTDFSFAWSVPDVFLTNKTPIDAISSSPCGIIDHKDVEYSTYTLIALPGILLGFSALQRFVGGLASGCFGGEVHACFKAAANVISLFAQISLCGGLFFAAAQNHTWTKNPTVSQNVVDGYGYTIKATAYVSATFIVGVKLLGVFCHGPETRRLVLRATEAEAQFEAALQLALVATIFLASGRWTTRSILSGTTSILVIGRVGVQNFFNGQQEELAKASLLGKICVAISVLPVFVLTALFKIGSFAVVKAWNAAGMEEIVLFLLAFVPPALVLLPLKMRLPSLKDLTAATVSQGLVAELVSLHLWPCRPLGRKIGLAMTSFILLLLSSFLAWIIKNPDPDWTSRIDTRDEADFNLYKKWAMETSARLQITGILCLVLGWVTFPLIVCQVFYQKKYVANILGNHLNKGKEDNLTEEKMGAFQAADEVDKENGEKEEEGRQENEVTKEKEVNEKKEVTEKRESLVEEETVSIVDRNEKMK